MARRAKSQLDSKTARLTKLDPRSQPYYVQVGERTTLGYVRRNPPPGSWVVREKIDGKYKRRSLGTADDVAMADGGSVLSYTQAVQQAANGGPVSKSTEPLTVKQAMEDYLTALEGRSAHARETRQRSALHILPVLGRHRVVKLSKQQVEEWRAGLVRDDPDDPDAKRRSQDSANRMLTVLKAALNHAFADNANRILSDNAWRKVKSFKNVDAAREDHFDAAQVRLLISKAPDKAFAQLLEAGFLTGARLGELAALDVRHFDAAKGMLSIPRGKTGARPVTLTNEAVTFFRSRTKDRPPKAVLLPKADGSRWKKSEQHRPIKAALKAAKLPLSASFYTLRHSHISRAIESGMPLTVLAENCGTSVTMIARNYAKVIAGKRRELVEATAPKLRLVK